MDATTPPTGSAQLPPKDVENIRLPWESSPSSCCCANRWTGTFGERGLGAKDSRGVTGIGVDC